MFGAAVPLFITTYALEVSSLCTCYFTTTPLLVHCTHLSSLFYLVAELNWTENWLTTDWLVNQVTDRLHWPTEPWQIHSSLICLWLLASNLLHWTKLTEHTSMLYCSWMQLDLHELLQLLFIGLSHFGKFLMTTWVPAVFNSCSTVCRQYQKAQRGGGLSIWTEWEVHPGQAMRLPLLRSALSTVYWTDWWPEMCRISANWYQ